MPLMRCMSKTCCHEWEASSDKSLCDWCGEAGYVLQEKTDLERFSGELANPEFRARLLTDLKERQRFGEREDKKILRRYMGVGEMPPQFAEQSPSPTTVYIPTEVEEDKCIDKPIKFDGPIKIWGQKTLEKRPSDGTVDMSDSKSDGH